jgi:apolipoprotein N-acyltransferase
MQRYTNGYKQLAQQGVDAVLTPEAALPFMFLRSEAIRQQTPFWQALNQTQVPVWLGSFVDHGNGKTTQSLVSLQPNGQVLSRYDKIKLVPLGEYIPLQETLGKLIQRMSPIKGSLVPGSEGQLFQTPWGVAIAGICFDSAFSHLFRNQAAAGGEFILTASNNNPYNARMMMQHHAQDVMRAIETDRWAARATNTGYSAIVDPHGITRWISGVDTLEVHADVIYRRQTQTLYVRWDDWLMPVLAIISLGGLWSLRRR